MNLFQHFKEYKQYYINGFFDGLLSGFCLQPIELVNYHHMNNHYAMGENFRSVSHDLKVALNKYKKEHNDRR